MRNFLRYKLLFMVQLTLLLMLAGCLYDSEEALFPTNECDTSSVSYSLDIAPLLSENCLDCHSSIYAASLGGNIQLEDYEDVSAQAEIILGSIKHEANYSPMPKNSAQLPDCDILSFEAWIKQGKLEN